VAVFLGAGTKQNCGKKDNNDHGDNEERRSFVNVL